MGPLNHQTKYSQLADVLRERLRNQQNGDKLPSVRALMKRFGVSQHTVTSALRLLEEEHLISRKLGSGVYMNHAARPVTICMCRPQGADYYNDLRETELRGQCRQRGWELVVNRFDPLKVDVYEDDTRADAYVLLPALVTFQSPLLSRLAREGIPMVIMGRDTSSVQLDFVTGDDGNAIREFVHGLVRRGHRHLGFFSCEYPFYEIRQRMVFFQEACRMMDVESTTLLELETEYGMDNFERSEAYLRKYLKRLKKRKLPFSALLTSSMTGALPAPLVFMEAGYRVPDDVTVCSLGGHPQAKYMLPPVSSPNVHFAELAVGALGIIEKRLAGDKTPLLFERVPYHPVWREDRVEISFRKV